MDGHFEYMEDFKYLKYMGLIMPHSSPKKYPSKYSIIAGEYVATRELCRWGIVSVNGKLPHKLPEISPRIYEKKLKNASNVYPLLLPFGTVYLLLNVKIDNNTVNLNIQSFYRDAQIPVDYLGLLTYVATEIIRNGYYKQDDFLKRYKPYYDKIKQKIPEKYEIIVNGEFANIDLKILYDLLFHIREHDDVLSYSFNTKCINCPLQRICNVVKKYPPHFFKNNIFFASGFEMDFILLNIMADDVFFGFENLHIDPIIFVYISSFKHFFPYKNNEKYTKVIEYMNLHSNKAVLLNTNEFFKLPTAKSPGILCLKDGKLYTHALALREKYPDIRIFSKDGDVTKDVIYREIARESLIGILTCFKLEDYLSKNYSNKERNLFYFALLNFNLDHETDKNNIFFVEMVYNSKLYKEGLIRLDNNLILSPTEKMLEIMETLCGVNIK